MGNTPFVMPRGPRNRRGWRPCHLPGRAASRDAGIGRSGGRGARECARGRTTAFARPAPYACRPAAAGRGSEALWQKRHICNYRIVTSLTLTCCVTVYLGSPVRSGTVRHGLRRSKGEGKGGGVDRGDRGPGGRSPPLFFRFQYWPKGPATSWKIRTALSSF